MSTPVPSSGARPDGDPALPSPPSRAGRNLPAALGVGLGLAVLVVASLFVRKEGFLVLATAAICVGVWELRDAVAQGRIHVPLVPSVAGAVAMMTAAYVPFLASFSILMLAAPDGAWRVFVFILVTVCSDVGGYAVGVVAGRHPMAPSVSPKKSWEGFAGSVAACVLGGALSVSLALHGLWWAGALVGAAAAVTATLGDLTESTVKRDLGIKDMGSILPGHGGLMDRLDSLLLVAPVVWALLTVFVPSS